MSEVISFRLDKNNPREARALDVIRAHRKDGYGLRHIITEALLKLDEASRDGTTTIPLDDLNETLNRISELLEEKGEKHNLAIDQSNEGSYQHKLADSFVASVRKAAKPGIGLD